MSRIQSPGDYVTAGPTAQTYAKHVLYDYLKIFEKALKKQGLH